MIVRNYLTISDEEFLADSIRCWQEALKRGDLPMIEYWARHSIEFAKRKRLRRDKE